MSYLVAPRSCHAELIPHIQGQAAAVRLLDPMQLAASGWPTDAPWLLYLPSAERMALLAEACRRGVSVALLPYPGRRRRSALTLALDLQPAIALALDDSSYQSVDLLLCNGLPVLEALSAGELFSFTSEPGAVWPGQAIAALAHIRHRRYTIQTAKEQSIRTAASGILVVENHQSGMFRRLFVEPVSRDDGRIDLLLLAPKSLLAAAGLVMRGITGMRMQTEKLPDGVAFIQSEGLRIDSPQPIDFRIDGVMLGARSLQMEVRRRGLRICQPAAEVEAQATEEKDREILRIQGLPRGQQAEELAGRRLPLFRHASTEDFKDLFGQIRENARFSLLFFNLLWLSSLIATTGLFMDSPPVIIGAMILAPLMAPIVSLAMGLARADQALLVQSARTLGGGILVVLGVALAVSQLLPLEHLNAQMSARTTPNLLDLVVALFSGIAGAYATANEQVARSVAGVAIAVALVPPLSVSGIGLGWGEFGIFLSAGLLFVTNLFGIAFGAALTFWVMGYAPLQRAGRGMVAVLVLLALVSIPLSLGLQSMLERERILQRLDAVPAELFASAGLSLREVRVQPGPPPRVMLQLESRSAPEAQRMRQVRERLLERLGRAPMDLRIGVQLVY